MMNRRTDEITRRCLFPNPYLHSGVLSVRMGVIFATVLWGLMVLWQKDAFARSDYRILGFFHEDLWGAFFLIVAVALFIRTWSHKRPNHLEQALNVILAFLWTNIVIGILMKFELQTLPVGGTSACITMMLFSWWNLVGFPRKGTKSDRERPSLSR